MHYSPGIDGLRALAVIAVVLFHTGWKTFGGGFIGVDIFFVISGYLITSILLGQLEKGSFRLREFYTRRMRRILPALLFVLLCCLPFAWLWLLPSDLQTFGKNLSVTPVFLTNFLLWKKSGYFDTASSLKPLLHTWSLAVEAQYYLLFPLALAWSYRRKKNIARLLVSITLGSFILAETLSHYAPFANFFLLPSRFWELAAGALLAFHLHRQTTQPPPSVIAPEAF